MTGDADQGTPEHVVILSIALSEGGFGSPAERSEIKALEHRLDLVLKAAGTGDFDGDEFGGGKATMYFYGTSADRLFETILPVLRSISLPSGTHVIKRYGEPGAVESRVTL